MTQLRQTGSTLIEVLIATAIFSIFVITIFLSIAPIALVQVKSQQKNQATRIAQELLEITYNLSLQPWPFVPSLSDSYHPHYTGHQYTLESGTDTSQAPFELSVTFQEVTRDPDTHQLDPDGVTDPDSLWVYATVSWPQNSPSESVTLSNLLIKPAPTP